MLYCLSKILLGKVLDRIRHLEYFGIIIHKYVDFSTTSHFVVLLTFAVKDLQVLFFLKILDIQKCKKDATKIFDVLLTTFKK